MITQLFEHPEIFRIKVPLPNSPLKDLNVYILRRGDRSLMIDTGYNRDECRAALRAGMAELGLQPGKVDLFLTHLHADHTGLVWEIVNDGGTVYMSRVDSNYLNVSAPWKQIEGFFREEGFPDEQFAKQDAGNHGRKYVPKFGFPVVQVDDGDVLQPWGVRCIATPGHTPGHMCLYLPEQQILFSGDHILMDITPNITIWGPTFPGLRRYMESLSAMRSLPVRHTLPAHREGGDAAAPRIDALLEHHASRLAEVEAAVAAAPGSTAYDTAQHITWSMRGLGWDAFPPGQKWFAMGETLAHLHYLADEGRVGRRLDGALYRYFPV